MKPSGIELPSAKSRLQRCDALDHREKVGIRMAASQVNPHNRTRLML